MKKVFFAIAVLLVSLASCSKDEGHEVTPSPEPTPEPTPLYATVNDRKILEEVIVDKNLGEYIFQLASQTETEPVYFEVPTSWNAQVTIWNPLTQQWVSTRMYSTTTVTHNINGEDVEYTRWTDNTESDAAATRARITWATA